MYITYRGGLILKKILLIFVMLIILFHSFKVRANEVSKSLYNIDDFSWEMAVGDSPTDSLGKPLWIQDENLFNPWSPCSLKKKQLGNINISEDYLWLRTKLPNNTSRDAAIFIMTYNVAFQVYLDDKLLYQSEDFESLDRNYANGAPWKIIDLPEGYSGKTLYIRTYGYNSFENGILADFQIGSKDIFPEKIFKQDISKAILAGIFVFLGACSILIYLSGRILKKVKEKTQPFLLLGLCSIDVGLWLISQTKMIQYFLNAPVFWSFESHITLYTIPIFLCLFLKNILNHKFKPLLSKISFMIFLFATISIIGSVLQLFPLPATLKYFHLILIIVIAIVIYLTIYSLIKGHELERVFGIIFILFFAAVIIEIARWYILDTNIFNFTIQWAALLLVSTLSFALIYYFINTENKLKIYKEELKLKEEILEEKKRLLQEMSSYDKMKTDFFVNISHELRTPLNIILSTLQLLKLYADNNQLSSENIQLSKYLKAMKQNCYRLLRLVNNVIDITKIDSGFLTPVFKRQDIVSVIEDTALSAVDYIKANDIEFYFDTNIEEKYMCFDKDKLERILLNLLSNAIKFSNPSSTISVQVLDKGDTVSIIVKDTGIGMHKDTLETIFDKFAQADKSLSRCHEGSGIGLSLVKALVEIHNGKITVESKYGVGSTFTVTLPTNLQETPDNEPSQASFTSDLADKVLIEFSDLIKIQIPESV